MGEVFEAEQREPVRCHVADPDLVSLHGDPELEAIIAGVKVRLRRTSEAQKHYWPSAKFSQLYTARFGYECFKITDDPMSDITQLLRQWREGDAQSLDRLMPLVYEELRRLARRQMVHERRNHTLQPTALVHEAFRRLIDAKVSWNDRVHFFAVAAKTMRRILVEHARKTNRVKHGGRVETVSLDARDAVTPAPTIELLALDLALDRLAAFDERKARAVELHYFGGMTYEEAAAALEVSPATFHRELRLARVWLQCHLSDNEDRPE